MRGYRLQRGVGSWLVGVVVGWGYGVGCWIVVLERIVVSYSSGLKPLSELERLCVCRAAAFMFALRGERAEMKSLMRGAGSHFDYEVTNDLYEYRDVLRELSPRFVVECGVEDGEPSFQVEGLLGWEPRVEPGLNYCFDAVVRVAELMLGREFDGWESEECKVGLLCSCAGALTCPSRKRVIKFLKEARAHTKFVSSESVVAVLSAIQDALANPWKLPRPDGYGSEPYPNPKIVAWSGDDYIDGVLIPWACRRLGIWYEGDYSLTKQVLSTTVEEPEEPESVVSVAPEKGSNSEPAGEALEQMNVQAQVQVTGTVEEPAGTPGCLSGTTGSEVEPVKRRSWFRRLFGV